MKLFFVAAALVAFLAGVVAVEDVKKTGVKKKHHSKHHKDHGKHHGKHHHHHHHHHHGKHHKAETEAAHVDVKHVKETAGAKFLPPPVEMRPVQTPNAAAKAGAVSHVVSKAPEAKKVEAKASEDTIVKKMKALEEKLEKKKVEKQGQILVNGPLPADFKERFAQAVGHAIGTNAQKVKVTKTEKSEGGTYAVSFKASPHVVEAVEEEASDPDSKLASGPFHSFLVAKGDDDAKAEEEEEKPAKREKGSSEVTPVQEKGIDIDTAMPYGDLEPFGREDTAQELTEDSVKESDSMVDQLERAEVAEEKRAVFRALTRLRGAAITSFDGVARSQTGNIDEYNKVHKWRNSHPLHHLADEESDISKWAFPDNADF